MLVALSIDSWRIQDPPDLDAAQHFAESAVESARKLGKAIDLSHALGALATVFDGRSQLRESLKVSIQRLEICANPAFDNENERLEALRSAGSAYLFAGEYDQAMTALKSAYDLALKVKSVNKQADILGLQAQCYFRLDRWDEVLSVETMWRDLERRYSRERVGET